MKTLLLILTTLTFGVNCFGQIVSQLTITDPAKIETAIEMKTQKLKNSLKENIQYTDNLFVEFSVDTFKVEERLRFKLNIDYSTHGITSSILDANNDFDNLLNKYYRLLLKSLNDEDKEVLIKSQRNWIIFRDSELKLNEVLMSDYYQAADQCK